MANVLEEIVSVLTQVKLATLIAEAIGITVPVALTNAETAASTALATVQNLTMPDSLSADLKDAATVAAALTPLLQSTSLGKIVTAIQSIQATNANLASGQLAIVGTVSAVFNGHPDKVVIAAYRESGTFASLVDNGVTDANTIS